MDLLCLWTPCSTTHLAKLTEVGKAGIALNITKALIPLVALPRVDNGCRAAEVRVRALGGRMQHRPM